MVVINRRDSLSGVVGAFGASSLYEVWPKLNEGLDTVYNGQMGGINTERFMFLYTEVYNYCWYVNTGANQHHEHHNMQPHGADLVGMEMYRKLENYIRNHVIAKKKAMASFRGEELLVRYHKEWVNFCSSSKVMHGIFQQLNRRWIKRELDEGNNEIYVTFTLALVMWRQSLFMELKDYVTDALLDLIQRERDGIEINTTIIKGVIESYVDLGNNEYEPSAQNIAITGNANSRDKLRVYKEHFEDRFIKKTEEYYTAEASNFLQNGTTAEYMEVKERLDKEQTRCGNYINETTQIPLAKILEKVLIQSRLELFQNEFEKLLKQHNYKDFVRMCKLCERVDRGLDELRIAFERYTTEEGHAEIDEVTEQAFNDIGRDLIIRENQNDVARENDDLLQERIPDDIERIRTLANIGGPHLEQWLQENPDHWMTYFLLICRDIALLTNPVTAHFREADPNNPIVMMFRRVVRGPLDWVRANPRHPMVLSIRTAWEIFRHFAPYIVDGLRNNPNRPIFDSIHDVGTVMRHLGGFIGNRIGAGQDP